ncbi:MAG: CBS domain-containing protein [Bacteroidetes bacterium]|nr:CBS domain-containing protein [Bacteroidota bacterium]
MKVKQAMHKTVNWQPPGTSLSEIAKIMKKEDIGAIPIGENDRLIGMVTDRDIVVRGLSNGSNLSTLSARDVMTKRVLYCHEDDDIKDAVSLMKKNQVRRLPVLNGDKRMTGMLSLGDVSHSTDHTVAGDLARAVSAHH